jgi:hypothetical protein
MDALWAGIEKLKEDDPLAVLQADSLGGGENGGQFRMLKLAPNFEISLFLAQATGASIVTDSAFRWHEISRAMRQSDPPRPFPLSALALGITESVFLFPSHAPDIQTFAAMEAFQGYSTLMRDAHKYLSKFPDRGSKPNVEANLFARFSRTHATAQALISSSGVAANQGRARCVFPSGGIQDNNVNRLLLLSSSEAHLPRVPMAFYMTPDEPTPAEQTGPLSVA